MPQSYAIFCSSPLDPQAVEPDFAIEAEAARSSGFEIVLIDHDELDRRVNPKAALRKARIGEGGSAVYRGWMMRAEAYESLYYTLRDMGIHLLTSPACYAACHHAPGSYDLLKAWMPDTRRISKESIDDPVELRSALTPFGSSALILKDWVKSQAAGYWRDACFIPDASDDAQVDRVVSRFRELQSDSLVGGLVFKEYISLLPRDGQAYEFRAFAIDNRIVGCWPRSNEASRIGLPPESLLNAVAAAIPSPFASADFGLDETGRWWLLEVGDGQVSGLPTEHAATTLFAALAAKLKAASSAEA